MSITRLSNIPKEAPYCPSKGITDHMKSEVLSEIQTIRYHGYSMWLFTFSDIKTIILPSAAFALLHDLAGSKLSLPSEAVANTWTAPVTKYLTVLAWIWINLLPFVIDNQRQIEDIKEDRENKPWRPMPSGRLSRKQARSAVYLLYPLAVLASIWCGASIQNLALLAFGLWYNDFGGADANWYVRNVINACGFMCYTSGALQVAIQTSILRSPVLLIWILIIGAIVMTTVHTQDMYDQIGDKSRGRQTAPLALGDARSRWTIALPVAFWSFLCPWFWSSHFVGYTITVGLGTAISFRTLLMRSVTEDKMTFRLWNLWLVTLYTLPLLASTLT